MRPGEDSTHQPAGTTIEELERFRQDIERYRARRKAVLEEFEGFVRGFRTPPPAAPQRGAEPDTPPGARGQAGAPPPSREVAPRTPHTPAPRVDAQTTRSAPAPEARPIAPVSAPAPPISAAPVQDPPARVPHVEDHRAPARRAWLPLAFVAILLVAIALWQFGTRAPDTAPDPATAATAPPTGPSPAPAPAPPPVATVDPSESVLTTTRPVWLRVIADGNRIVNRELPAGARVPFKAERTIEIRAGDAGAVHLSIGGRDQGALGPDGAVLTRSFTVGR